jgi:hypothetical protein
MAPSHSGQPGDADVADGPLPTQIRVAREAAGLTQGQAAALIGRSARWWRAIETVSAEHPRTMDPLVWELWQLLAKQDDDSARRGFMEMRRAVRQRAKVPGRVRSAVSS